MIPEDDIVNPDEERVSMPAKSAADDTAIG